MEQAIQRMIEGLSSGKWTLQDATHNDILEVVRTACESGTIYRLAKGVWFCGATNGKIVIITKETRGPSSKGGEVLTALRTVQERLGKRKKGVLEFSYDWLNTLRGKPVEIGLGGIGHPVKSKVRGKNMDDSRRIEMLNTLPKNIRQTMQDRRRRKHFYDPVMVMFTIFIKPPQSEEANSNQENVSSVDDSDMPDITDGLASFYD